MRDLQGYVTGPAMTSVVIFRMPTKLRPLCCWTLNSFQRFPQTHFHHSKVNGYDWDLTRQAFTARRLDSSPSRACSWATAQPAVRPGPPTLPPPKSRLDPFTTDSFNYYTMTRGTVSLVLRVPYFTRCVVEPLASLYIFYFYPMTICITLSISSITDISSFSSLEVLKEMSSTWLHVLFASVALLSMVMDKGQVKEVITHNGQTSSYGTISSFACCFILWSIFFMMNNLDGTVSIIQLCNLFTKQNQTNIMLW